MYVIQKYDPTMFRLDVVDYNAAAIKFYLRNGFVQWEHKQDFYYIGITDGSYSGVEMIYYFVPEENPNSSKGFMSRVFGMFGGREEITDVGGK